MMKRFPSLMKLVRVKRTGKRYIFREQDGKFVKTYGEVMNDLTKGGLNSVTKELAIEYAKRGIRFNAVSPGIIKTPMHGPETYEFLGNMHPVGHMGETQDIVDGVLYLESAGFVTGEILNVDGGAHAGRW